MALVIDNLLGNDDLSQLGKPFAEANVDKMNTQKRLPAILLVDTSRSMEPYSNLLAESVKGVYDAILSDRKAGNVTELGVMAFNSEINILEKMREIRKQKDKGANLSFDCKGVTLTGLAIKAALAHLEARIDVYKNARPVVYHYAPILFFISDGKPECYNDLVKPKEILAQQQCLNYIQRKVASNELVVVSVEVGDKCDHDLMVRMTGLKDDRHVIKVNNATEFSKFFKLSSSVIISSSKSGSEGLNSISFKDVFGSTTY